MAQDGACLAILASIEELSWQFRMSGGRSLQKWPKCKNEHHYKALAPFGSWGIWLEALGAILGRLGQKLGCLGRSWPEVGTLLAAGWDKVGEDDAK